MLRTLNWGTVPIVYHFMHKVKYIFKNSFAKCKPDPESSFCYLLAV